MGLPASPAALAWAGARLVAGGGKKGGWWGLAGAATGAGEAAALTPTELVAPAASAPAAAHPPGLAVTLWDGGGSGEEERGAGGGDAPPPEAVVLSVEGGSAVAAADGGRAGRAGRRLAWRGVGVPAALAASPPYIAACLPGGVEVRCELGAGGGAAGFAFGEGEGGEGAGGGGEGVLIPGLACMAVAAGATPAGPAPGAAAPRPGAPILVAGGGRVVRLVPRPFGEQADAAAAAGRPRAALALAALAPPGPDRAARLDRLRATLAASLFGQGEVEEALGVLALVGREEGGPGGGEAGGQGLGGGGGAAAALALLRLFPSLAPAEELESIAAELGVDSGGGGVGAPRRPPPEPADPAAAAAAAAAVLPYLVSLRGRLLLAPLPSSPSPSSSTSATTPAAALASLVDTAIVRAHLASGADDGSLLRFLSPRPGRGGGGGGGGGGPGAAPAPGHAVPSGGSGEAALRAAGRYAEVVALLQSTGRHEAALEVLKALATDRASLPAPPTGAAADLAGVTAAWAAVRALHAAGAGARPDLIQCHASWVLASDPDAGLGLLLGLAPPPPPAVGLAAVRAGAPALAAPYLEAALEAGIAAPSDWEPELADLYVRACLPEVEAGGGGGQGGGAAWPDPARPRQGAEAAYARLLALASSSPHIDPARLLAGLPPGALLALRAALLERAGQAGGALRLCVFEARDDGAAEVVAARAAARAVESPGNDPAAAMAPFLDLARLLVERDGGSPGGDGAAGWAAAARLLARATARGGGGGGGGGGGAGGAAAASAALGALPDGVPVATALPALEAALGTTAAASRAAAVERALRRADGLAARAAAAAVRGRSVLVGPDRACCHCTRRLGVVAFVALPGGRLAHYACHMQASEAEEQASGGGV